MSRDVKIKKLEIAILNQKLTKTIKIKFCETNTVNKICNPVKEGFFFFKWTFPKGALDLWFMLRSWNSFFVNSYLNLEWHWCYEITFVSQLTNKNKRHIWDVETAQWLSLCNTLNINLFHSHDSELVCEVHYHAVF